MLGHIGHDGCGLVGKVAFIERDVDAVKVKRAAGLMLTVMPSPGVLVAATSSYSETARYTLATEW
jgi:hypothetical protein